MSRVRLWAPTGILPADFNREERLPGGLKKLEDAINGAKKGPRRSTARRG